MPASSLIFLLIVALWAAYLVPGAIRRHRRTAAARTADRDSQAMRVVVRRGSAPVGSALAAAAVGARSSRPVLTGPAAAITTGTPITTGTAIATGTAITTGVVARPSAAGSRPAGAASSTASRRVVARRRRLLATVAGLTLLGWVLVAAALAPWWSGALPTLGLLLVVAALSRHGAAAARTVVSAPVEATVVLPHVTAPPAPAAAPVEVPVPREAPAAATPPPAVRRSRDWQPVPVPLPTYLLKPKAPRVAVPAEIVLEDETPTQVIDLRDHVRAVNL